MSTYTQNSSAGSAKATTVGPGGVELELILNAGDKPFAMGGIPHPDRGAHGARYSGAPCGGAVGGPVAPSALVVGF